MVRINFNTSSHQTREHLGYQELLHRIQLLPQRVSGDELLFGELLRSYVYQFPLNEQYNLMLAIANQINENNVGNKCFECLLSIYLETAPRSGLSASEVCEEISRLPPTAREINIDRLRFHRFGRQFGNQELAAFAAILPNVSRIDIEETHVNRLPSVWEGRLTDVEWPRYL